MIAAGGVSALRDIEALLEVERFGVIGVIIGKALYSGGVDLGEALALARHERKVENSGFP